MSSNDSLIGIGDPCPDFTLPKAGGGMISLSDFAGKYLVLYFYPRADTPGCTTQAIGFGEAGDTLDGLNAGVLGVSKDPVAKLEKFVAKRDLTIPLASDEESDLCEAMGVWKEKSMYGKTYMGIERSTFLIGPEGHVVECWRKVRVKGHVEAVIEALRKHSDA